MIAAMRDQIIKQIKAFAERKRMSLHALSVAATGDRGFINRLISGKNVTLDKLEKIQAYMREHKNRR